MAEEDNWPAGDGYPRMVRCQQCNHWSEWRYVCEKGALEGLPLEDVLECWWCYMQRKGGNVTWGEVKKSFAQLYSTGRGHRVGAWQNLLFYVSDPQDNVSALSGTEARQSNKRVYDAMRGEQIAFRDADAGSEDIEQLPVHGKVTFKYKDQYVGINDVPFDGVDCLLFNWASTPKSATGNKNVAMATLANKETGAVITKGRALEGSNAAHNLCVVTDKC